MTLLGKNVSWWSVRSQKTNRYPFEGSVRAFQRCRQFIKLGYGVVTAVEIRNRGSLLIRQFSLQNHSFAIVAVVNVERREGPKSCGERSGQTDRWNRDPSVAGRRSNFSLAF